MSNRIHQLIAAQTTRRARASQPSELQIAKQLAVSLRTGRLNPMDNGGEVEILRQVISNVHGCESRHAESVRVLESFQGQTVWDGEVHVFELCEPYLGRKCFAWGCVDERPRKQRRYVTVLEASTVRSASEAVRASLTSDARTWPN